jgi:hypothetical protein
VRPNSAAKLTLRACTIGAEAPSAEVTSSVGITIPRGICTLTSGKLSALSSWKSCTKCSRSWATKPRTSSLGSASAAIAPKHSASSRRSASRWRWSIRPALSLSTSVSCRCISST